MLKEKLLKIKEQISKNEEENNKRKIENLVVFLVILIVTIIAINAIWNTNKKDTTKENDTSKKLAVENTISKDETQANDIEKKLENILAKINGVGEVNVLITYSESSTIVPVYNEDSKQTSTKETDTRRRN